MKRGKIWGETELLLQTPLIEIHRLTILPNSRCSLHVHARKWNAFFVQSGVLRIEVHNEDYNLIDVTMLRPGEFTTVPPGIHHCFVSKSRPVQAIEIYYPDTLSEDISRKDCGSHAR